MPPEFYDEIDLIRRQRGLDSLSQAVREALDDYRDKHWREQVGGSREAVAV